MSLPLPGFYDTIVVLVIIAMICVNYPFGCNPALRLFKLIQKSLYVYMRGTRLYFIIIVIKVITRYFVCKRIFMSEPFNLFEVY